jgi:glyoxalase family protein
MTTETQISGIHHITAVASSAAENLAFYETILGLRLVKQTVNFDDPHTYHLYYGDARGTPGTILTFFPWEDLPPGRPGTGMVTAVAFAVNRSAMDYWNRRIATAGRPVHGGHRFGEPVLSFSDPHGLPLELIGVDEPPSATAWEGGPVEGPNAIHGFHSATATVTDGRAVKALLQEVMGLRLHRQDGRRYRFVTADAEAPGHFYDLMIDPQAPPGRPGGGTVHHIAFRTASDRSQAAWQAALRQTGMSVTAVRDRTYFRSIYFQSPGGILFEIATDPPGFGIDEPLETLGTALKLPEQYEPLRADIEHRLPPLHPDNAEPARAAG